MNRLTPCAFYIATKESLMRLLILSAAIAVGAALSAPAIASESLAPQLAQRLDKAPVEFTMTAAKQRRLMMIEESQRRQRYGRPGYGYGRPGYGRPGYGYGRPQRPQPGYGYGARPGWGPPSTRPTFAPPPPTRW